MSLWGLRDLSNNAPIFPPAAGLGNTSNGMVMYQNTTPSGFVSNVAIGIYGTKTADMAGANVEANVTHAGWNMITLGTGGIATLSVNVGGAGYSNSNNYLVFTGGGGTGANASYVVNANGGLISVTILNPGYGYTSAPTVTARNANTSAATFTVSMGGRSGRTMKECLVAAGSLTV